MTYPFDIIRRRMQTFEQKEGQKRVFRGIYKEMAAIAVREGVVGGLYKGFSLNFVKGPIATVVCFTVNDLLKLALR